MGKIFSKETELNKNKIESYSQSQFGQYFANNNTTFATKYESKIISPKN